MERDQNIKQLASPAIVETDGPPVVLLAAATFANLKRRLEAAGLWDKYKASDGEAETISFGTVSFAPEKPVTQTSKLVNLSERNNSAASTTPRATLEEAIRMIDEERIVPTKLLVLALNDRDGQYSTNWFNAGMKSSEMLTLCRVSEQEFLQLMGY